MKFISTLIIYFICVQCYAAVYSFTNSGDYTDQNNWDIYPGLVLSASDTIYIEAICNGINLQSAGHIDVASNVDSIVIENLSLWGTLDFHKADFKIKILGSMSITSWDQLIFSNNGNLKIINHGSGVSIVWWSDFNKNIEYVNYGSQSSSLLSGMKGVFHNYGTILVNQIFIQLECDLDLANGLIHKSGGLPFFYLHSFNGSINQYCSSCTAIINNISDLHLRDDSTINGTVILNDAE